MVDRPNVLVVNEGFSDNIGDQAIQRSMEEILDQLPINWSFLDYSARLSVDNISTYQSFKKNDNKLTLYSILRACVPTRIKLGIKRFLWLRKVRRVFIKQSYDAIILGGGQMVQSNGVFPFYFRKLVQLATLKNKACKVIFFGIGIGKNLEPKDEILFRDILSMGKIYVRDTYSLDKACEFGLDASLIPDVVYGSLFLNSIRSERAERLLSQPKRKLRQKVIICLAGYSQVGKFKKNAKYEIEQFHQDLIQKYMDQGASVEFICSSAADLHAANDLIVTMGLETTHEASYLSLMEFIVQLRDCDVLVSGRMHPLIFARVIGVDVVVHEFSQKLKSFSEDEIDLQVINNLHEQALSLLRQEIFSENI